MRYWDYLKARGADPKGLTEALADHLAELFRRGHSVADLLAHYAGDVGHLPPDRLRALQREFRGFQLWRKRLRHHQQARSEAGLPPLPDEVVREAPAPDQLDALVRTARLSPRATAGDDDAWARALRAGADLWRRCLDLARKEGRVRCKARQGAAAELVARHATYLGASQVIAEIPAHRWLAMRRGESEGALTLEVTLPEAAMVEQVALLAGDLGPGAEGRTPRSLLEELVLDDLLPWLFRLTDIEAEEAAIAGACANLVGLLEAPSLSGRRAGAIYVGRAGAPVAAVVVDREDDLLAQRVVKTQTPGWVDKLLDLFRERNIHQVVLPARAPASDLLGQVETRLAEEGFGVTRVRPAALAEARVPLTDPPHRLTPAVASAVVIARRALDPLKAWSAVDPVKIGVAEYQHDLDPKRLRAALAETVDLCRLKRRRARSGGHQAAAARAPATARARLNPLVRSIHDLRPGMTVNGVITNISHFGAFVSLGLPQEGLAHISELSDQYVANPNDVVRIGQQVTAHVLAVDPPRGRISLSLKTAPRIGGRGRDERGRADAPGRGGTKPMSRAEALASLERLFKK